MPISTAEALREATRRLHGISDTPRLDAELLLAHALGIRRDALLLGGNRPETPDAFWHLLARREGYEPLAYIIGIRDFWTISVEVGPGVLIPRPDSETLIEAAVDHFDQNPPRNVLDLGTGPGTLLLAALDQWPEAVGLGIDRSQAALAFAQRNADRNRVCARVTFRQGDWADGIKDRFDLILCNPPYIERDAVLDRQVAGFEPPEALFAGQDGLDDYRLLAQQIPDLIAPGGLAVIELGAGQRAAVEALFAREDLHISARRDLAGHERALLIHRK